MGARLKKVTDRVLRTLPEGSTVGMRELMGACRATGVAQVEAAGENESVDAEPTKGVDVDTANQGTQDDPSDEALPSHDA
jgi:hypothetical protein